MGCTRRQFLSNSAMFAAAPMFLRPTNKSGSQLPRVGEGKHVYECHHDWAADALPDGANYGNASHGVTIDAEGLIYITHQGTPDSIFVFTPAGKFVRSMGAVHNLKGRGRGHGIDIRRENGEEFLYLAPADSTLGFTKMTLSGEVVWTRDRAAIARDSGIFEGRKLGFRPTNTSFRPDGGYYLGDGYGSNYVFEYDKDDKFVRAIGGAGTEPGQFRTPHGQWLDDRGGTPMLTVADRANKRLQWFDMQGQHVKTLDGFLFPADIDIAGKLMLVPDLHARVTLLDGDDQVLTHLGEDAAWREQVLADNFRMRGQRAKWKPGRFVHPHDACFDPDGNIFVVEWVSTGRVTKLVRVS